jgi:hypothetical protein
MHRMRIALAVGTALVCLFSFPAAGSAADDRGDTAQTAEYSDNPCCRRS